jgi:hypothetical protein
MTDEPVLGGAAGRALAALFDEIVEGPPGETAFILNPGDEGLLRSLDRLGADEASRPGANGSSVASHAEHLRYSIGLLNRWQHGEEPFSGADYAPSWDRVRVSESEWADLRRRLAAALAEWRPSLTAPRDESEVALNGVVASVVHLAYHFGAIRQLARAARGPRAREAEGAGALGS